MAGLFLYGVGSLLYSVDKGIRDGIRGYSDSDKAAYKTHWQQAADCYEKGDMEGAAYHIEKSPDDGSYPYENRRP